MSQKLRLLLCQFHIHPGDKKHNLEYLGRRLAEEAGEVDVILLPEVFASGFGSNHKVAAEIMQGDIVQWMQEMAKKHNTAVCGTVVIQGEEKYYNRLLWVEADGVKHAYDKRHLFSMGGEDKRYQQGHERLVFEYRGFRIMPQICYDLRFPVWSRNDLGYDLLIYLANWPVDRVYAWQQLLIARAIENQAYAIGINACGPGARGYTFPGSSMLVDAMGAVLAQADDQDWFYKAEIDLDRLQEVRESLPFLVDRDSFQVE